VVRHRPATILAPIFALTGFSALTLQVVWQRVISLHSGVDLSSATTVVAAFLGGLGAGSLLGGRLADRLRARRSLLAFAAANAAIGLFAWISVFLFYDLYRELAPNLQSTGRSFAFNVAVLIVPTTLMGLSLPLVARAVTERIEDAGRMVGRLYGINTVGAALGAAVAGWFLLGNLGFVTSVRLAGGLNLVAAVLVALLWRSLADVPSQERERPETQGPAVADLPADDATPAVGAAGVAAADAPTGRRIWPWFVAYFLTGAAALGLEQLFFRLIDAIMRSNSYSFAHVLTLYLVLFGTGAAVGSKLVRPGRDPRRWFLGLQLVVGVSAMAAVVALVRVLPALGFDEAMRMYLVGEGYNGGFGADLSRQEWARVALVYLGAPLALMGLPVLCMGASFPFVQALVSDRMATLGRRTGLLVFANVCGNVMGALVVGFVLLDVLGTAGSYRLVGTALGLAGLAAASMASSTRRRALEVTVVVVLVATLAMAVPSNQQLWAFLNGVEPGSLDVAEGHSCAAALKHEIYDTSVLTINASLQNAHPYDDFHVLIGLLPALVHPSPERALAIGLGIGSTTYGMLQDPRVRLVRTVELCGPQYELLRRLGDQGRADIERMLADPRYDARIGDGRKHLLAGGDDYDVITVDTLRPTSAFSGSLYSKEFYELVESRLADGGIMAQWAPTPRVVNTVASVFPHVVAYSVERYANSTFLLASREPLDLGSAGLVARFAGIPDTSFLPNQKASLLEFMQIAVPSCVADGSVAVDDRTTDVNLDLRPRDEYFINNGPAVEGRWCRL